jgi:hypothetical protein
LANVLLRGQAGWLGRCIAGQHGRRQAAVLLHRFHDTHGGAHGRNAVGLALGHLHGAVHPCHTHGHRHRRGGKRNGTDQRKALPYLQPADESHEDFLFCGFSGMRNAQSLTPPGFRR